MATDTLEIFGKEYAGVTAIDATDDNNQTKTYIRGDNAVLVQDENGYINIPSEKIDSLAFHTTTATTGSSDSTSLSITNIPSRPAMFFLFVTNIGTPYKSVQSTSVSTNRYAMSCIYDGLNKYCTVVGGTANSGTWLSVNLFSDNPSFTYSYSGTTVTISFASGGSGYFPVGATYTFMYVC